MRSEYRKEIKDNLKIILKESIKFAIVGLVVFMILIMILYFLIYILKIRNVEISILMGIIFAILLFIIDDKKLHSIKKIAECNVRISRIFFENKEGKNKTNE